MILENKQEYFWLSESSNVQSLIFDKDHFSVDSAKAWAAKHDFNHGKVDTKENTIRLRQKSPGKFKRFATKTFGSGIKAVIGFN